MKLARITVVTTASLATDAGAHRATSPDVETVRELQVDTCLGSVHAIRSATLAARFASPQDRTALVIRLDEAREELGRGKLADAARKLDDYGAQLRTLVAHGRLAPSPDGAVTPRALL